MLKPTQILKRHEANPIITPGDYPGVMQIFNPSPVFYKGKIGLFLSMVFFDNERGGETRLAWSENGTDFEIEDHPFITLDTTKYPYNIINRHLIDSRVTQMGDTYYILTPLGTGKAGFDAPCTILGKTTDFKTYELIEVVALPRNRGASLFPEKIGNRYCRLDRPGGGKGSHGAIWVSYSPDLIHWGSFRPLLAPFGPWGSTKIGPTPPLKTDEGWLVIIHGVKTPCDGPHYYIGAMLLDLENPEKIIGRMKSYLLAPEMPYETNGSTDNVVFPCGALIDPAKDELRLYYGGADTNVCLATGSLRETIEACKKEL